MMLQRAAAGLGAIGVALGAFGAHGLEGRLTAQAAGWWDTATFYLLVHAVAVLAVARGGRTRAAQRAGWLMASGAATFAGTLYAMALGAPTVLGAVTPVGGVLMIAGWISLALEA